MLAAGSLDLTFGAGTGKVVTPFGPSTDEAQSVAVQADGMILVAGYTFNGTDTDFALARYNADGSPDPTFDGDGKVTTDIAGNDDMARSVAVQPDGKILAAGSTYNGTDYDFVLVRYNANGTLDAGFGSSGKVVTPIGSGNDEARSLALQADGRILVAGYSSTGVDNDFALVRYNANGTLDAAFGSGGKVITPIGPGNDGAYGVAVQTNGRIVVAGSSFNGTDDDFAVVRYNAGGTLDGTFGSGGKVTTPVGSLDDVGLSLALQADGEILVAGASGAGSVLNYDFAVVRYDAGGGLDAAFGGGGKVVTPIGPGNDLGRSVVVQPDGKIVVAGSSIVGADNDFALVRYNIGGSLDSSFDGDGIVTTAIGGGADFGYDVALQTDGKIVVAGSAFAGSSFDFAVARYENDPLGPRVTQVLVDSSQWKPAFYTTLIATDLGTASGYKVPSGAAQVKTLWFNGINRIALVFDKDVDVQQGDLTVTGVTVPVYSLNGFSYSAATRTAVWTLPGAIGNDKLTLRLDGTSAAAVRDLAGNKLDGEWTNYSTPYPSGNGSAGGDFSFRLNVLPADVNQDNIIDVSDIQTVAAHYLTAFPGADVNGSNLVDISEIQAVAANYLQTGGGAGGPAGTSESAGGESVGSLYPRQAPEIVEAGVQVDAGSPSTSSRDSAALSAVSDVVATAPNHRFVQIASAAGSTDMGIIPAGDGRVHFAMMMSRNGRPRTTLLPLPSMWNPFQRRI